MNVIRKGQIQGIEKGDIYSEGRIRALKFLELLHNEI